MARKTRKKQTVKNASVQQISNGLGQAIGFGQGVGGGVNPVAFGISNQSFQAVSDTATSFENLRYYLVSNFRQLLSQLYVEIGLVQTIVTVPVDDGLRGGGMFKSKQLDEGQIKDLQLAVEKDGDLATAGWAAKWTRLYGGGGILIIVDDQDPETELDLEMITDKTKVTFRAVDMWELYFDKQNIEGLDLGGLGNEDPLTTDSDCYQYYNSPVHTSRVMILKGVEAPSYIRPRLRGWGVSVVETLIRSMNQYLKATDLGFEVLDEFKLDIYKLKNLTETLLSSAGTEAVRQRVQMANWQKNYQNAVIMDSEDDFDHKQLSFAGLAEAMAGIRMQVASDMRMPILKLFGQSVSTGMSSSSSEEMENYNSMVESEVRTTLKYHILKMAEIKCQQLFGLIPDDLELEFKPLRELAPVDQETVKTQKFARAIQAKQAGELTTLEFRDVCNKGNLFDVQLDTTEDGLSEDDQLPDVLSGKDENPIPVEGEKPGQIPKVEKAEKVQNEIRPFTALEKLGRIYNSAEFDRASYEADGGRSWIDEDRLKALTQLSHVTGSPIWASAKEASYKALGDYDDSFALWMFKKLGGKL